MVVDISAPLLVGFVLALVRALAWLLIVPPFGNRAVMPTIVTVGLAMSLALVAAPHVAGSNVPLTLPALIGAVAVQVLTGAVLGFIVSVLLSAVTAAGSLADLFGGIVLPPSVDPLSTNQTPMLGQFYEQVAVVLLFAGNGELLIVDGFLRSFNSVGLTLSSSGAIAHMVTSCVATFFTAALEIAAPVIIVLFAAQIVLGMVSKAIPQMNVYWLGFPFQIMLSFLLIGASVTVLPGYVNNLVNAGVHDGAVLLAGAKAGAGVVGVGG
jgi:flagellar biosynthetic protein FliR